MSALLDCCQPCPTVQTVNVPGPEGPTGTNGTNGTDGINSTTFITANFTVPAVSANVTVAVADNRWMVVGQNVFVQGPANFSVVSVSGQTAAVLQFLGYTGDVAPGTVILAGAQVSPGGIAGANGTSPTLPLSVANGGTGSTSAATAAKSLGTTYRLLGKLIGANFNVTTDQSLAGLPTKYIIRRITVTNASVNMTTVAGGWYTGAGKTGTTIVAAGQAYTALTASTKWIDSTIAPTPTTDVLTATTIFFSLTTGQGAPATGDLYVFGEDLS